MSTGFRETNMGYTFSPVRATMGIITSQRHERLQVGSDYQNLKRAVVWKRLPDQSCGLWWRDIPSQSDSVGELMRDKYSFLFPANLWSPAALSWCYTQPEARGPGNLLGPHIGQTGTHRTGGVWWQEYLKKQTENIQLTFHLVLPSSILYLATRMIFLKHESNLVLPQLDVLWWLSLPSDRDTQHKMQGLMICHQLNPPVLTIATPFSTRTVSHM